MKSAKKDFTKRGWLRRIFWDTLSWFQCEDSI